MRIKINDKVQILTGKDKGKKGKVLQVLVEKGKIVIEGLNLHIKHVRPRKQGEKGQRIQYPTPIDISNVALLCSKCNKKTKVGYKILGNKKKVRMCRKCKEVID